MENHYDAICLSGGGTKGILLLGALQYLFENKMYQYEKVKEYAGTSIGSALALLLSCGYTPMEIFSRIYMMESFFNVKDCGNIWTIIKEMGLISIQSFIDKLKDLIIEKFDFVPTLEELKTLTGKTLYVSSVNLTNMCEQKLCHLTHPDMSCLEAVKISCNLPIVFQRLKYKNSLFVDGGILNNYPWNYLSNESKNVLGIILSGVDKSFSEDSFFGYFYRLMILPANQMTELRHQLAPPHVSTMKIKWGGSSVISFSMKQEDKMKMFVKGYDQAEMWSLSKDLVVKGW